MSRLGIDPATWSQLSALLDQALEQAPATREQWLDSLGSQFERFKPQLRDLLSRAAGVESGDFLNTLPAFALSSTSEDPQPAAAHAGARIGAYRLVRELGRGGMGSVWLAERVDGLIARPVALKLPHGVWHRPGLAERMAREREILATLDHPNIARLFDAGLTPDGQPYLALEYVEGAEIDRYCAPLALQARLSLFLQVANAVAYAHGKLIVHRDLKPANILVTPAGQARLLDFGIAKLLDEGEAKETRLTELSGRALTPDYASPEQIVGEPLTVASDVYSLGVILYELLTGTRPYRLKRDSRGALEDAILQTQPARPSEVAPPALRKALRGDLDTIVAKALKKIPQERYATVNALAEDIARYLSGRPVLAQPDSGWYRTRKFVARNRLAVAASSAIVLAIVAGAGAATWQMFEAHRQRDVALQHQRRAEAYSEFMGVLMQDAGAENQPLTPTALFDRGVTMLERRKDLDESVSAFMWYELSRTYLLFVQTDRELDLLKRSAEGARRIGDLNLLAASECAASWSRLFQDRAAAEASLKAGQAALAQVAVPADYAIMDCTRAQSRIMQASGQIPEATALLEQTRARLIGSRLERSARNDILMTQLSDLYRAGDRFKDSLALSAEQLRAIRASGRAGSTAEFVQLNNHAGNLVRLGEYLEAVKIQDQLLEWARALPEGRVQPMYVRMNRALTLLRLGEYERAVELAEEELTLHAKSGNINLISICHATISQALLKLGRIPESEAHAQESEKIWNSNPGAFAAFLQEAAQHRADIALARGDIAGARDQLRAVLTRVGYPERKNAPRLDRVLRLAARIELTAGDGAAAERFAADALQLSRNIAREERNSADVGGAALLLAQARDQQGRKREAAADAQLAAIALRNGFGAQNADALAAEKLATTLQDALR